MSSRLLVYTTLIVSRERPLPARLLLKVNLDTHLAHAGLEGGQIDLAVGLERVGVTSEALPTGLPHRNVEHGAFLKLFEVHVPGVLPRRDRADDAGRYTTDDLAIL